ncbi:hypothetical protein HYALB_00005551, partial [Hymenoscyphus albidus]
MKEAIHRPLPHNISLAPILTAKEGELIVKIVVAGANRIDWKGADEEVAKAMYGLLKNPLHRNAEMDFAEDVHEVGPQVYGFSVGDRVVALNHRGYAEYGVGPAHIPDGISFSFEGIELTTKTEAATTGWAYITAALGLYKHLRLPPLPISILNPSYLSIYGATSATALYAVKIASLYNIHPTIAIARASGPEPISASGEGRHTINLPRRNREVTTAGEGVIKRKGVK